MLEICAKVPFSPREINVENRVMGKNFFEKGEICTFYLRTGNR
jgi:hypothetical protein